MPLSNGYELVVVDNKAIMELVEVLLADSSSHERACPNSWGFGDVEFIISKWLDQQPKLPRDKFQL